jgi:2-polyprenyl-3-methyl-5-hydroxy-6-metoxy-1,4-benzoquinol methylase
MTDEYSDSSYYDLGYPEGIESHFWNVARNALIYKQLEKIASPDDHVLDVGCGSGIFLSYARDRGINISGVEKGPAPLGSGLESVIETNTDLFDLDESIKQGIAVVLLLDVLEHIEDRQGFLREIHRQLPNCEYLLVTVPARREIWTEFDRFWGHHLRYNRAGINRELQAGGFAPVRTAYFFNWVYLLSLLLKCLGVKRKTSFESPRKNRLLAACHWFLGHFTRLESALMPGFIVGSSIVCVARRHQN